MIVADFRDKTNVEAAQWNKNFQQHNQEHIRMLEALATVSSLAFMAVIDFMLAYFGGDWLDRHLETGDHTMRGICIALAVISLIMTYYNLIQRSIYSRNDAGKKKKQDEK